MISNCRVVDVVAGVVRPAGAIGVVDGRFVAPDLPSSTVDPVVIDARGGFLVPGFIDAHVHVCVEPDPVLHARYVFDEAEGFALLRARRNLEVALKAGITTVRDVGSTSRRALQVKDALAEGLIQGPRVFACGHLLTGHGGWGSRLGREVGGVDECREAVNEEIAAGADFIKIINDPITLTLPELRAIIEESHAHGRRVACHAYKADAVDLALEAGADTIEHAAPADESVLKRCRDASVTLVPTYVCSIDTIEDYSTSHMPDEMLPVFVEWMELLNSGLPKVLASQVNVATGTDAGIPPTGFASAVREIKSFARLGASNARALQCATINAAGCLGLEDELGTIEYGKLADCVILEADPLLDISAVDRVRVVVRDGCVVVSRQEEA